MYGPGGARSGTAGAVTCSELPPDELNWSGMRSSLESKVCVTAPLRISTTAEIPAASGEESWNDAPYASESGAWAMAGRAASDPSELNRYGGENISMFGSSVPLAPSPPPPTSTRASGMSRAMEW